MLHNNTKTKFPVLIITTLQAALVVLGATSLVFGSVSAFADTSIATGVPKFDCTTPEASIPAAAAKVVIGASTYYIGTVQASAINQNPVISKFTAGTRDWCNDQFEQTGVDGRGLGLLSTPTGGLYAYFSVDGGGAFNFGTTSGWQNSYGSGGGAKVSVISLIDTTSGTATNGTFVKSRLPNGNTNSLELSDLRWDAATNQVQAQANAYFSPLDVSGNPLPVTGQSPFNYVVVLNSNLTIASGAYLGTLSGGSTPPPVVTTPAVTPSSTPAPSAANTKPVVPLFRTGGLEVISITISLALLVIGSFGAFFSTSKPEEKYTK